MRRGVVKIGGRIVLRGLPLLALLIGAPAALAQPAAPDKETQRLFEEGNTFLEARNYGEALARYRAAYERYPNARILLNMGTALHGLGRNAEALDTYERFRRDPKIDSAHKQEAVATMRRLEAQVARLDIDVSEPGAALAVDGRALESAQASLWLDPGPHTVVAMKDGFRQVEETISLEAAQTKRIRLVLTPRTAVWAVATRAPVPPEGVTPARPAGTQRTTGVELGLRAGYGVPFGTVDSGEDVNVSHFTSGAFPLILDVDVRLTRNLLLGGLFQYAFLRDSSGCEKCSGRAIRLGVTVGYRRDLGPSFSARAGVGSGYEWLSVQGGTHLAWSGLELVHLEALGDLAVSRTVRLGPFMSFSLSRYTEGLAGNSPTVHSWLLFGLRAGLPVWP
jgi:PEGA domain